MGQQMDKQSMCSLLSKPFGHFFARCLAFVAFVLVGIEFIDFATSFGRYARKIQNLDLSIVDTCSEEFRDLRELSSRIVGVQDFLREPNSIIRRDAVLVIGAPGMLSESVGRLLGQGSEALYLPDILRPMSYYMKYVPTVGYPLLDVLLDNLFRCRFKESELLLSNVTNESIRRHKSASFASCFLNATHRDKKPSDWLTCSCRHSNLVVAQSVFVNSLSDLTSISQNSVKPYRLKLVHVVRDPREVINSLLTSYSTLETSNHSRHFDVKTTAYRLCMRMLLNMNSELPPDRYKLVSVERLLSDTSYLRELFQFAGVRVKETMFLPHHKANTLANVGLTSNTLHHWRREMKLEHAQIVEKECGRVMKLQGL
ncbi:uncharacterized protein LOC116601854 [Nematostella vectensis]|uniref:uncharacterized protein LOC116601854 n=1 Tax=Nematostella vectensis TaxID=45351 RepID=UPI00138FE049|nr:uncharacterized protein LOC116601854 [Nematostella vectensis]